MSPQYAQVSGGKMHRLLADVDNASAFRPTRVACGRTVEPANYFDSRADALAYCGNRGEYLCSQCACRHDVSLYGRCADCGMTWDEQATR